MGDGNSSHWKKSPGGRARVLWVGLNWIGDTLMSMPAIQAWRRLHPSDELTVLVKPGLRDLWSLFKLGRGLDIYKPATGLASHRQASRKVRRTDIDVFAVKGFQNNQDA